MKFRSLTRAFVVAVVAVVGVLAPAGAASAGTVTTQHGKCKATPLTPTVSRGRATLKVSISCPNSAFGAKLITRLRGDDPGPNHPLQTFTKGLGNGTYTVTYTGIPCNEDRPGRDEIYLSVKLTETHTATGWTASGIRSADCS